MLDYEYDTLTRYKALIAQFKKRSPYDDGRGCWIFSEFPLVKFRTETVEEAIDLMITESNDKTQS